MSRIDELIERLCPDGVEYKALGEVASYGKDRVDSQKLVPGTYVGVNELLPNFQGRTYEERAPLEDRCIAYQRDDILLGNIRPYLKKMWLADCAGGTNGDVLVIRIDASTPILPSFLYRVLAGSNFTTYNVQHSHGAKMPRGDKAAILDFRIPVPPMEVQEEIVRMLDFFAKLEAELEAELEARRKQYAFYRSLLLNFSKCANLSWGRLGEIGELCMCKRIFKDQTSSFGDVPFYKIGTFGNTPDAFISYELYREYRSKYSYPKKGDLLISCSGTIGRTIAFDGRPAYFQDSNIVWIDNDESMVTNRFLKYWYSVIDWPVSKGGTIGRLYGKDIKQIPVPIPPLEEQHRIVSILDKFDALVNDLTSGLPAEIEARRKQYEYYRDKLLTFKEKPGA